MPATRCCRQPLSVRDDLALNIPHSPKTLSRAQENMAVTERHLHDTSDIPPETLAQLAVRHETVTPWWWALWILIKYRTTRNYKCVCRIARPPTHATTR